MGQWTYHDRNPGGVENGKDDVSPPSNVADGWRGDVDDDEVADPVGSSGDGRTLLSELEWQDLGWVDPDRGLETDGEGSLEDEEHGGGADTGGVGNGGLVLDLVDQTGLDSHDAGHDGDHGEQQWATSDAVDEGPWNERSGEEPGVEETGHESGHVRVEAQTLLEESTRVVDKSVDTTELLEDLDTTSDQETALALDAVILEEIAPGSGTDGDLERDGVDDVAVHALDLLVAVLVTPEALKDMQTFVVAVVSSQPSRSLGQNEDEQDHWDQEDALQDGWNTPDEASRDALGDGLECKVDPVDHHNTEIECRELHADVETTVGLWRELGLEDWDGRVDETHTDTRNDTSNDDLGELVRGCLEESTCCVVNLRNDLEAEQMSNIPTIMIKTPVKIDFLLPRLSPTKEDVMAPMKAPISKMETIRAIMFVPFSLSGSMPNVSVKAGLPTKPPMRPLSKPMRRKPRHVKVVTAEKRALPSSWKRPMLARWVCPLGLGSC